MGKRNLAIVVSALVVLFGVTAFFLAGETTAQRSVSTTFATATAPSSVTPTATDPVLPTIEPTLSNSKPLPSTISGVVSDASGPVAGAIVQIQGKPIKTQTSDKGTYSFAGISGITPLVVTAWSAGHYVGYTSVNPSAPDWKGGDAINISMNTLPVGDNNKYDWFSFQGVKGSASCGLCHREYKEWLADAHSQSAKNVRFISMYSGTNVNGDVGQDTKYGDKGVALPPDPSKPYFGPGFKLDTPDRAGNCATCHTPLASKDSVQQNCAWSGCHMSLTIEQSNGVIPPAVLPISLHGDAAEGITCDFCHKIGDVALDPKTNMPYPDSPGILSMQLYRPKDDSKQVFFGTMVDVARPDSYLPLLSQSRFCASCHFGIFGGVMGMNDMKGGTVIYNSYGEWLNSPYSDPKTGLTCQQCHMPVSDQHWTAIPSQGGLVRDYQPMFDHTMPGASDEQLLQNAVTMKSDATRNGDQLQVQISITNDKTGHDVPTDAPIRSVILVVEAKDASGKTLTLQKGPVNPHYSGNYSGIAGKTFAKVLKDNWTGETPTGAFWRPTTIVEDTRLVAMTTDTTNYTFNAPAGTAVTVNVRLVYRRAFAKLEKEKGWNDPDIMMAQATIPVPAH